MSASGLQETVCGARPAGGDLAAIWRQKRWLEKVDGLLDDHSHELCRGEVRWGESSSATPCAVPRLSHWEVFAVPLRVVDSSRSKAYWVFDHPSYDALLQHSFMMSGKKNDRTMYRPGLLFEMEKVKKLTKEE